MKYLLSWNDEWLSQCIEGGPMSEEEARELLKERVLERLVKLKLADNRDAAEQIYKKAASKDLDESEEVYDILSIGDGTASIIFGSDNEERYEIVEYDPVSSTH